MSEPGATVACGPQDPCAAADIDAFFLPLITHSLAVTRHDVPPPRATTLPLVAKPAPPPERPQVAAQTVVPVQRLLVGQTLFADKLHDGGDVDMFFEILPVTDGAADVLPNRTALAGLALAVDRDDPDMLAMERLVSLPAKDVWQLTSLSQPVAMRVICGACAPDGGISHFNGAGKFEIRFDPWGTGRISDIKLRGEAGQVVEGEMNFNMRFVDGNILTDDQARLRLVIGQDRMHLTSRLLAWRDAQGWVAGTFIGVPETDVVDPGAIAGQFSGVDCVPACGVEN